MLSLLIDEILDALRCTVPLVSGMLCAEDKDRFCSLCVICPLSIGKCNGWASVCSFEPASWYCAPASSTALRNELSVWLELSLVLFCLGVEVWGSTCTPCFSMVLLRVSRVGGSDNLHIAAWVGVGR